MAKKKNSKSSSAGMAKRTLLLGMNKSSALKLYALILIVFGVLLTSNMYVYSDSFFALGNSSSHPYVIFATEKGEFASSSINRYSFKPEYISRKDFDEILKIEKVVKGMQIWDDQVFDRIYSAISQSASNGWIESVSSIERSCFPAYLKISLVFRKPYAIVEYKGNDYFIDSRCKLLPIEPNTKLKLRLVRIQGINVDPPYYGETWEGDFIADSVGLLKLMQMGLVRNGKCVNLYEITTRVVCEKAFERINSFKKPKLTLVLYESCEIVWDVFSLEKLPDGKADNKTKLRKLADLIFRGKVDDLRNVKRIDLTSEGLIYETYGG